MSSEANRRCGAVDVVKFLCALLIVAAHYVTENATGRIHPLIDYGVSLYVIVVPFFFACGGYFLFRKVFANGDSGAVKSYIRRILVLYGLWSAIYVTFQVLTWLRFGTTAAEVLRYLLNALLYSTYRTIWFLPALCVGVAVTWWLWNKLGMGWTLAVAGFCCLIGALGVSYSFLITGDPTLKGILDGYNYAFESTRNGLFNGFPFVALGALAARQESRGKRLPMAWAAVLTVLTGIGFVAEAFVLKHFGAVNANTLLMLIPFTYVFLRLCLRIPLESGKGLLWLRKMSTTVFLCQRLYLTALPALFPRSFFAGLLKGDPYIGLCYVLTVTVLTAAALQLWGKRNRRIGALC